MLQRPPKKTKRLNTSKNTTPKIKLIPGQANLTNWLTPTGELAAPIQSTPTQAKSTQSYDLAAPMPVTETKGYYNNFDIPLNQPSVQVESPTQNGDDVASIFLDVHGENVEVEETDDEVEVVDVSNDKIGVPMASLHHMNKCGGCGNPHNQCHEFLFGPFLCHKILSLFDTIQPHEITKSVTEHFEFSFFCVFVFSRGKNK